MNDVAESLSRPIAFLPHLRAETVTGEATYLFADNEVTVLRGEHITALAPALDGTSSVPELLRSPPPGMTSEQVGAVVRELAHAGLVGLCDPARDAAVLAYWSSVGLQARGTGRSGVAGRVRLIRLGDADSSATEAALGDAGLDVVAAEADADLSVVLCRDYLDARLAAVDADHRAAGRPWLLAKPIGTQPWFGPVFQADGACWHCLAYRLRRHRPVDTVLARSRRDGTPVTRPAAAIPPLTAVASGLIALEATKWLAGYRHPGQEGVCTLDSLALTTSRHELRRRPQCPRCGDPTLMRELARRPIELVPRAVADTGGGRRAEPPERTLDRYRHLISPVTGIIKEIRRDPRGPAFFNVFWSGPNVVAGGAGRDRLRSMLRSENGGKGVDPLHAEVGALCEAVERYSGTFHGDEERVRDSLRTLGDDAIHPNRCQLFHPRQYRGRAAWNAAHNAFHWVPEPFDEALVTDWTPVWSLTGGRHRLLPTAMLYFGVPGARLRADSNGNAAGTSREDAVLQGLFELVERDAVALWWYNRTRMPGMDLDAFGDPWIDQVRTVHAGLGRTVWALNLTADLGIPAVVALSRRTGGGPEQIMFGFGANLDPRIALRRALTELNQMMPPATGDGRWLDSDDPDATAWWRSATVHDQPYLSPDPSRPASRPEDFAYQPSPDLTADVRTVQARLEGIGLEVLVLDQTRPDIGLPVVKVIVPGLRHFWARYGPGRLYDVPVRLGLLVEPTPYHELNPIPMFL